MKINLLDCGYDAYPTLEISFFGAVQLANDADCDKYIYCGYGIGFDRRGTFLVSNGLVIIFGIDLSSSVHVDNKKK